MNDEKKLCLKHQKKSLIRYKRMDMSFIKSWCIVILLTLNTNTHNENHLIPPHVPSSNLSVLLVTLRRFTVLFLQIKSNSDRHTCIKDVQIWKLNNASGYTVKPVYINTCVICFPVLSDVHFVFHLTFLSLFFATE